MSVNCTRMAVITITAILLFLSSPGDVKCDDFHFLTAVSGDSIGDRFYNIAKGRGDVNGDGYEDVLIGAPYGGLNGYAKLFLGGAEFDTIPDFVFYGENFSQPSLFGFSCAFIGDVNSDGFDDILIGDPDYGLCLNGRACLYFGGFEMDTIPDLIFDGECLSDRMGYNVSGAGDVNGDGYDDWLILSPQYFQPESEIYLYYGSQNPDNICEICFEGNPESGLCFDSPALGDINGDGFDDLIFSRQGSPDFGLVEIHLGSSTIDTIPDLQWFGTQYYIESPVSGIGDVNDDGYDDWVIRLFYSDDYHLTLYYGSDLLDTVPDMNFEPESPCSYIGWSSAGGDINGDRINDLLLNGHIENGFFAGQVLGYIGGATLDNHYDFFFDSGVTNLNLGSSLGLADINGDSICEVLAGGVLYESPNYYGPGQVWFLTTQPVPGVQPYQPAIPTAFSLSAYPNPFNPTTTIRFQLPEAGFVKLGVFDVHGRNVGAGLKPAPTPGYWYPPGTHKVTFDASGLSSGLYFCRIQMGDYSAVKKMVLLK